MQLLARGTHNQRVCSFLPEARNRLTPSGYRQEARSCTYPFGFAASCLLRALPRRGMARITQQRCMYNLCQHVCFPCLLQLFALLTRRVRACCTVPLRGTRGKCCTPTGGKCLRLPRRVLQLRCNSVVPLRGKQLLACCCAFGRKLHHAQQQARSCTYPLYPEGVSTATTTTSFHFAKCKNYGSQSNVINTPDTSTTQANDNGRSTFQPRLIS